MEDCWRRRKRKNHMATEIYNAKERKYKNNAHEYAGKRSNDGVLRD